MGRILTPRGGASVRRVDNIVDWNYSDTCELKRKRQRGNEDILIPIPDGAGMAGLFAVEFKLIVKS